MPRNKAASVTEEPLEQRSDEEESEESRVAEQVESGDDSEADVPMQKDLDDETAGKKSVLTKERLEKYQKEQNRRGVVYLSRIPPYMNPQQVKSLLSRHGKITRMHIVEEDKSIYRNRVKRGGNKHRSFAEGWIEFEDKGQAEGICQALNGNIIGGKKRSFYHDDMWNLKFLKGFKWEHLLEKLRYERKVQRQKLKFELAQRKKADSTYLEQVDAAKQFEKMIERKGDAAYKSEKIVRTFHQTTPLSTEDVSIVTKKRKLNPPE